MSFFVNVAVNVPLNQTFTYKCNIDNEVPEQAFGRRVEVRFGNRKLSGFVVWAGVELPENCAVPPEKIREISRFIDKEPVLTAELFEIAKWISFYYIAPIGEAIFAMVPSGRKETDAGGFSFAGDEQSWQKRQLSTEQQEAVDGILSKKSQSFFHYLYGMTGSGKTEVFLSAAEQIISEGKSVIYLVPEIGLTPQVAEAVVKRFGNTAAILHSALSPSQRLGEWKRILKKEARVVIGARSAVFAPVPELGLIIMDEEHDGSYKSGSSPRYHARQVAMHRANSLKIPFVMGSATPSVEAYSLMKDGLITKHILTRRLAGGTMPEVKCVNLSLEASDGSSISPTLEKAIKQTLIEKKQVILFLNRRGFTNFFKCNSCGFELKCKNCSVSLTYHKSENRLRCHYCGYSVEPPHQCPKCGSLDIGYFGFGTEYIESEVKAKFPLARIIRVDTDSIKKKGELQEKIILFAKGEADIMLGTQMVAKGLNFKNLQLVGIILADSSLHLPDFRAAERTFSLITQVSGRAGRYFPDGKVLVQSFSPDMPPIDFAVKNKIDLFYQKELEQRKLLNFPPYSRLLRLVFRSAIKGTSEKAAYGAAEIISKMITNERLSQNANVIELLGPSECPLEMVAGNYRHQIILRGRNITPLRNVAAQFIYNYTPPSHVYIEVDVDPVNMM